LSKRAFFVSFFVLKGKSTIERSQKVKIKPKRDMYQDSFAKVKEKGKKEKRKTIYLARYFRVTSQIEHNHIPRDIDAFSPNRTLTRHVTPGSGRPLVFRVRDCGNLRRRWECGYFRLRGRLHGLLCFRFTLNLSFGAGCRRCPLCDDGWRGSD
jgi:hypothetical protein